MDEKALIEQAGRGDLSAFQALAERYGPQIYRQAATVSSDSDEALELTQQTFLRAWHAVGLYREEDFSLWLENIAEDVCRSHRKHRRGAPAGTSTEPPAQLCRWIIGRIQQEEGRRRPKSWLGRMRFTLIALVIVLLLFLAARMGLLEHDAPAAAPTPAPSPTATQLPAEWMPSVEA